MTRKEINEIKARRLLRYVDYELTKYGPRRAQNKLIALKRQCPRGQQKHFILYDNFLRALLYRREMQSADNEYEGRDELY